MNKMPPQFFEYWVPSDLEADWFCPTCLSKFRRRELHDPFCTGVICERGHRFQFPQRLVDARWCELASGLPPIGSTEIGPLLAAWMQRAEYRGYLHSQAAAVLCRVHDFEVLGDRVAGQPAPQIAFRFCPQCSGELGRAADQWDGHSLQLVCNEGHNYSLHGDLSFEVLGKSVQMDQELVDVSLVQLCHIFGSRQGLWRRVIHAEIAAVFERFARRHQSF